MLRYRVAVLLLMFLFVGVGVHQKITVFNYNYILAGLALLFSYVSATTINDIVDKKIDKINHPHGLGRPLVSGEANEKELYVLNIITSILALVIVIPIGWNAVAIMSISLLISYIYSIEPIKISYRTHFAHIFLSIAYVLVPYCLGVFTASKNFIQGDFIFMSAFTILFFGRIILKDFRDRRGDSKYGKPTFLLKYGKNATCLISVISVAVGNFILMFYAFDFGPLLLGILQVYFLCIYFMAYLLWKAPTPEKEQESIGIGAKMGNGLILTILGLLVLQEYGAPKAHSIIFASIVTLMFLVSFTLLLKNPKLANVGYRG